MLYLSFYSFNTDIGCSVLLKKSIKVTNVLSFWYLKIVLGFFKVNKKTLYRNLKHTTLELEKKDAHLMFNETCYSNEVLLMHTNIKLKKLIRQKVEEGLQTNIFLQVSTY